jgi:hypothetical protein
MFENSDLTQLFLFYASLVFREAVTEESFSKRRIGIDIFAVLVEWVVASPFIITPSSKSASNYNWNATILLICYWGYSFYENKFLIEFCAWQDY